MLGVTRIGHGSHIVDDPAALAWAADEGLAIEVCPTSNVLTGAAPSIREHPMHAFIGAGCRVVLGDDNPINIGTRLAAEERRIVDEGGLSEAQLLDDPPDGRRGGVHRRRDPGRAASEVQRAVARIRRHSIAVQRSITTDSPPADAIWAASQFTTPSCSHRQPAPIATASSACGTTSSERRNTSTMSNGPVASAASAQRPEGRHPEHAALVRVHRNALEALVDEVAEDAERRPALPRRGAHHGDAPGAPEDPRDLRVVSDRNRPASLLEIQVRDRPATFLPVGVAPGVVRQLAPSLTYGCPTAAGGTLRPTTPARTTIVRT